MEQINWRRPRVNQPHHDNITIALPTDCKALIVQDAAFLVVGEAGGDA